LENHISPLVSRWNQMESSKKDPETEEQYTKLVNEYESLEYMSELQRRKDWIFLVLTMQCERNQVRPQNSESVLLMYQGDDEFIFAPERLTENRKRHLIIH
jgi:hypothetical protein